MACELISKIILSNVIQKFLTLSTFLPPIEKNVYLCPLADHWTIDKTCVQKQRILPRLPFLFYISTNIDRNQGIWPVYTFFVHM